MAARLATPAGKSLYKRRAALVEPAFAQFFNRFGRYVNYRGRDAVDTEIKLLATAHNLGKLLDYRRRQAALATWPARTAKPADLPPGARSVLACPQPPGN